MAGRTLPAGWEGIWPMSGLIVKMFIFVFLMVVGYVFARKGHAGPEFTRAASSLVLNVFTCATILNSVLTAGLRLSWAELGRVLLVLCVTMLLLYLFAAGVTRLLPIEKAHRAQYELLLAVVNNMFIALPVLDELFGPVAVFYCGLSNIPFNLLLYTYGEWRMQQGEGVRGFQLKRLLSMPLIATLAALLIFVTELPVPGPVRELIGAMSGATMPLSMIVIGASLSTVSLLDAFRNWRFYLASVLKLLVAPLLVWLVCGLLTEDPVLLGTATVLAAAPSGIIVTVLSISHNGDAVFSSEGILHSTVLSMLTIPTLAWLLL